MPFFPCFFSLSDLNYKQLERPSSLNSNRARSIPERGTAKQIRLIRLARADAFFKQSDISFRSARRETFSFCNTHTKLVTHESWSRTKGKREKSGQDNNWQTVSVREPISILLLIKLPLASHQCGLWLNDSQYFFKQKSEEIKLYDFALFVEVWIFLIFFSKK